MTLYCVQHDLARRPRIRLRSSSLAVWKAPDEHLTRSPHTGGSVRRGILCLAMMQRLLSQQADHHAAPPRAYLLLTSSSRHSRTREVPQ